MKKAISLCILMTLLNSCTSSDEDEEYIIFLSQFQNGIQEPDEQHPLAKYLNKELDDDEIQILKSHLMGITKDELLAQLGQPALKTDYNTCVPKTHEEGFTIKAEIWHYRNFDVILCYNKTVVDVTETSLFWQK